MREVGKMDLYLRKKDWLWGLNYTFRTTDNDLTVEYFSTEKIISGGTVIQYGEFGWGGTSAKSQRRCPKCWLMRESEISHRLKGKKSAWFKFSVRFWDAKARPIDPLSPVMVLARGDRKVTTGITENCGSQAVHSDVAFWVTSMSALPIIETQKSQSVGLFTR